MPHKRPLKKPPTSRAAALEQERRATLKALERARRQEKQIQQRARQLERDIQQTNDRLQRLAAVLGSHARALEAERDVDRSLETTGDGK